MHSERKYWILINSTASSIRSQRKKSFYSSYRRLQIIKVQVAEAIIIYTNLYLISLARYLLFSFFFFFQLRVADALSSITLSYSFRVKIWVFSISLRITETFFSQAPDGLVKGNWKSFEMQTFSNWRSSTRRESIVLHTNFVNI